MAIQLGSAYGKVSLDSSGWVKGIDNVKKSAQSLQSIGDNMKRLGQGLTAALTVPIAAMGVQSIKLARDMVETESKVKVVFLNMTDYVQKWSQGSAKSMQLSRQEALEAAATFGNLFVAMKIGREDAARMSTTLVQLAADLGSINNIDPSIALMKLKSGIVGETEAVRDLGIDLRATVVQAKAAEMGFKELNGQFSQGDLIAARYAIIMEQTAVAQGDIARTGGELAGQMRQLNAQWKDALAALGKNLLPIALKFINFLNQMLEKFNSLNPAQQKMIGTIILLVGVLGPLLLLFGTLLPMLGRLHVGINPLSGGVLGLVFSFVKLISALAIVVKVLTFFGIATGPIGAGILALNTAIIGVGGSILAAFAPVLLIIAAIGAAIGILYLMWKYNIFGMRDVIDKAISVIKRMWTAFMAFLHGDTEAGLAIVSELFNNFIANTAPLMGRLLSGFQDAWSNFMTWLRTALTRVREFIATAFTNTNWGTVGRNILLGIANGMLLGLPSLLAMAATIASRLLGQIKTSLGISSPSREAMKLGRFTAQGFMLGMQTMNPDELARSLTKPITNNSAQSQTIIQNFAPGVSLKQVSSMIDARVDRLANEIITNLGGA